MSDKVAPREPRFRLRLKRGYRSETQSADHLPEGRKGSEVNWTECGEIKAFAFFATSV